MCDIDYRQDNTWTVYVHIVPKRITGYDYDKYYVGITKTTVDERWRYKGGGYRGQVFWNAIVKYGWENIEHEIIAEKLTKTEAEAMEVSLIKVLQSCGKYGYNRTYGGNCTNPRKGEESPNNITVYQYSLDGQFIGKHANNKIASLKVYGNDKHDENIGLARRNINSPRSHSHIYKGYIWATEYLGEQIVPSEYTGLKKVAKINTQTNEIEKVYYDIYEPKNEYSDKGAHILEVCNGKRKQAYGYIWKFVPDSLFLLYKEE